MAAAALACHRLLALMGLALGFSSDVAGPTLQGAGYWDRQPVAAVHHTEATTLEFVPVGRARLEAVEPAADTGDGSSSVLACRAVADDGAN